MHVQKTTMHLEWQLFSSETTSIKSDGSFYFRHIVNELYHRSVS